MVKTAIITRDTSATALKTIYTKLLLSSETDISPLNIVAWCQRAIEELQAFKDNVKALANTEYINSMTGHKGEYRLNDFTVLTNNSGKGFYTYPAAIVKLEVQLKEKQAIAKKDGTAIKQDALPLSLTDDFLFRIKILEV